jgi:hypothetical protein
LYFSFFKSNNNVLDRLDNKKYYSTNLPLQETTLKKKHKQQQQQQTKKKSTVQNTSANKPNRNK